MLCGVNNDGNDNSGGDYEENLNVASTHTLSDRDIKYLSYAIMVQSANTEDPGGHRRP